MSSGLSGAKVAVIGLGASGQAAARLALTKGGEVYVSDLRADAQAAAGGAELRALGADVEWGGHDVERLARADLVVVSPGIPPHAPVLRALRERGVRWISEPELAVRFFKGPLIAITGTNGKTTSTLLVAHLLEAAGLRAAVGGNVGGGFAPAACELALRGDAPDWYVLEMSSFQLGSIERFRPDIGVVTNLSPDHLDWYDGVEAYYADKARLFDNADASSRWVLRADDDAVTALAGDAPGARYGFAPEEGAGVHAFVRDGVLMLSLDGVEEALLEVEALPLLGRHNHLNALAAALTARLAGAATRGVARGLSTARPLPHRLEPVADARGVLWVNDSKATNVAAARSALESLSRPVVLLLGGKDKGEDFAALRPALTGVRHVMAFGAAGPRIAGAVEGAAPLTLLQADFRTVVEAARAHAVEGDILLLSPACSSFDMFENYEDRGRRFATLAGELA
ncbi:MAG: UDP-N-acetylmuramoylalanine--D-glutamate ligase [Gemmatimonadota bacterium]